MKSEVRELLTEELKDAYSAEKQALRCMQRALRKTSAEALREGIQTHIEQTQVQIERVEQAMERMNVRPGRKVCEAMRGLVEEAQQETEEHDEKGPILDLVIVAGMQRIEHYEIAAYGTNVALAEALGEKEVADLLTQTLEEGKRPLNALPCRLDVGLCGEPLVEPDADALGVPGQKLCDAVDGMIGDAVDDVAQIGLGIEAVRLGGLCRTPDYAERRSRTARPSRNLRQSILSHREVFDKGRSHLRRDDEQPVRLAVIRCQLGQELIVRNAGRGSQTSLGPDGTFDLFGDCGR
jgi:ferritin-like metal-binding protein YciE